MKTYVKVLLLIAAALTVVGVICFGILAARGGLDPEALSSEIYTKLENEYSVAPDALISLDVDITELVIIPSPDDKIHLTCYESERFQYDIISENGRFSVKLIAPRFSFRWLFTVDLSQHPMTLAIPEDFSGSIDIKTTTGDVSVKKLSGITALGIGTTTGDVELEGISAESIDIAVKTGSVEAERVTAENEVAIKSTTGDIELDTVSAEGITTESTTGSQSLNSVTSEVSKHIATTGSIVFKWLDSDDITLEASTGSIRGTLVGTRSDYRVKATTSTGKSNIHPDVSDSLSSAIRPEGLRTLDVKTSTGDIYIKFEGIYLLIKRTESMTQFFFALYVKNA